MDMKSIILNTHCLYLKSLATIIWFKSNGEFTLVHSFVKESCAPKNVLPKINANPTMEMNSTDIVTFAPRVMLGTEKNALIFVETINFGMEIHVLVYRMQSE